MSYDSTEDTNLHIATVQRFLLQAIADLESRMARHDASKLEDPEKAMFDEYTPRLAALTYGSPEYEATRQEMTRTALAHHYAHNDHHPEHFEGGIAEIDLLQMVEMLADWKAATLRHNDGDLRRSINTNASRFGYGEEIHRLLMNTAERLGWL